MPSSILFQTCLRRAYTLTTSLKPTCRLLIPRPQPMLSSAYARQSISEFNLDAAPALQVSALWAWRNC